MDAASVKVLVIDDDPDALETLEGSGEGGPLRRAGPSVLAMPSRNLALFSRETSGDRGQAMSTPRHL